MCSVSFRTPKAVPRGIWRASPGAQRHIRRVERSDQLAIEHEEGELEELRLFGIGRHDAASRHVGHIREQLGAGHQRSIVVLIARVLETSGIASGEWTGIRHGALLLLYGGAQRA